MTRTPNDRAGEAAGMLACGTILTWIAGANLGAEVAVLTAVLYLPVGLAMREAFFAICKLWIKTFGGHPLSFAGEQPELGDFSGPASVWPLTMWLIAPVLIVCLVGSALKA